MISSGRLRAILFAVATAFAPAASGCIVVPEPILEDGYEPAYHDGNLVYYDDDGLPYYYAEGAIVYVPRTHVHFGPLVHHYQTHVQSYRRWYVHGGYRSKGYRQPAPRVHPTPPAHPPRPRH